MGYPLARLNLVSALAQLYGNFTFELAPEVRRKPREVMCLGGGLNMCTGKTGPSEDALVHGSAGYI